jgi:hypothetical protein
LQLARAGLPAKGGDDYTTDDSEIERQCEGERCVLLMAEMATAPPSTARVNMKTSKDFFITVLPDSIPAILRRLESRTRSVFCM